MSTGMFENWKAEPVPPVRSRMGNYWDVTIPAELIREMRLRPGITFQLLTDYMARGDA